MRPDGGTRVRTILYGLALAYLAINVVADEEARSGLENDHDGEYL